MYSFRYNRKQVEDVLNTHIDTIIIKKQKYAIVYCGFDIETTQINGNAYMYIWQFGLKINENQYVIYGRKWGEFLDFLNVLKKKFSSASIIVWVANLSFEFQFICKLLKWKKVFAKTNRQPLLAISDNIQFRECLTISQSNLADLAKIYTETQKMVGDLDYSILRNSETILSDVEMKYIENDVIILSEFSEYIFNEYMLPLKYIPMTATSILRHELKEKCAAENNIDRINEWVKMLHPKTKSDYIYIFNWLFRGGFVHSNFRYTSNIVYQVDSYDLKSSYPAVALQCNNYPMSPFFKLKENIKDIKDIIKLTKKWAVIMQITFYNIESKTDHSIESKSKCIELLNPLIDNGRVRSAEKMSVFITEIDLFNYIEFYKWDKCEIRQVHIAKKGRLPNYLINQFFKWFDIKESINKNDNPRDYAISKKRINGHYGMCVTKIPFKEIAFNDDLKQWEVVESGMDYDERIAQQILSPYWGIYITSNARRRELLLLKRLNNVIYSDTDSHKIIETVADTKLIKCFNKKIMKLNYISSDCNKLNFSIIKNLGLLEKETDKGKYKKFKTLGSKRYIYEDCNGDLQCTISGLNKNALKDYCLINNVDPFAIFDNGLCVNSIYTKKLTPIYHDEPSSDIVKFETMNSLSSVFLSPTDFTLNMSVDYLKLLLFNTERMLKHEC